MRRTLTGAPGSAGVGGVCGMRAAGRGAGGGPGMPLVVAVCQLGGLATCQATRLPTAVVARTTATTVAAALTLATMRRRIVCWERRAPALVAAAPPLMTVSAPVVKADAS